MAKKGSFSKVYDKNGDYVDVEAARFDGTRTFQMQGDVSATQTWNGDSASALTLNTSIGAKKVTTDKINDKAVQTGQIDDGAVGLTQIATNAMNGTVQDNDSKLATHAAVKTYVDSQISGQGTYLGKKTVAEVNAMNVNNLHNGDRVQMADAGTINLGPGGVGFDVVTGEDLILYKSGSTVQWDTMDGDFKTKQTAVVDPTASGTTITAIDTISQNANGEITATKKTIRTGNGSDTGVVKLSDSTSSTSGVSDGVAATPAAVKAAYDLASTANSGLADKQDKPSSATENNIAVFNGSKSTKDSGKAFLPSTSTWDGMSDNKVPTAKAVQARLDLKADANKAVAIADAYVSRSSTGGWFKVAERAYNSAGATVGGTWAVTIISASYNITYHYTIDLNIRTQTSGTNAVFRNFNSSPLGILATNNVDNFKCILNGASGSMTIELWYYAGGNYESMMLSELATGEHVGRNTKFGWTYHNISSSTAPSAEPTGTVTKNIDFVYAQKPVANAINGNFAGLDANGLLTDSGKKAADFATAAQGTKADSAVQDVTVDGASVVNSSTKVAAVPNASTSAKGAVQLAGSIGATVASENNKAATEKAVRDAINALDAEVTSNDGTNVQVKVTEADGKISAVNVTTDNTENKNNKVSSWQSTPDNTHYPTEKLVKDELDAKADADKVVAIADARVTMAATTSASRWFKFAETSSTAINSNICGSWIASLITTDSKAYITQFNIDLSVRSFSQAGSAANVWKFNAYSSDNGINVSDLIDLKVVVVGSTGNMTVQLWLHPVASINAGFIIKELVSGSFSGASTKSIFTYTSYTSGGETTAPTGDLTKSADWIVAKQLQTAVTDPTASGTALSFIDSITQNANGEITPTKKTVADATTSEHGLMSAADKTKLNGIAEGAEVNVQADWDATSGDALIKNKPYYTKDTSSSSVKIKVCSVKKLNSSSSNGAGIEFIIRRGNGIVYGQLIYKSVFTLYLKNSGDVSVNGNTAKLYYAVNSDDVTRVDIYAEMGIYCTLKAAPLANCPKSEIDFSNFGTVVSSLPEGKEEVTSVWVANASASSGTAPVKVDAYGALTACTVDSTPTTDSSNLVSSGGVADFVESEIKARAYGTGSFYSAGINDVWFKIAELSPATGNGQEVITDFDYVAGETGDDTDIGELHVRVRRNSATSYTYSVLLFKQKRGSTGNELRVYFDTNGKVYIYGHSTETTYNYLYVIPKACTSLSGAPLDIDTYLTLFNGNGTSTAPSGLTEKSVSVRFYTSTSTDSAVGSSSVPVYVGNNGFISACTGVAPLASPALTGTPTAPTAASGTNTTQLATTEFVQSAISGETNVGKSVGAAISTTKDANNNYWQKLCTFTVAGWSRALGILTSEITDQTGGGIYVIEIGRLADNNGAPTFATIRHFGRFPQNKTKRKFAYTYDSSNSLLTLYTATSGYYTHNFKLLRSQNFTWFVSTDATAIPSDTTEITVKSSITSDNWNGSGSTSIPVYIDADGQAKACTNDFVHDGDVAQTYSSTSEAPISGAGVKDAITKGSPVGIVPTGDFDEFLPDVDYSKFYSINGSDYTNGPSGASSTGYWGILLVSWRNHCPYQFYINWSSTGATMYTRYSVTYDSTTGKWTNWQNWVSLRAGYDKNGADIAETYVKKADVTSTYSATGTNPVNGTAVAAAIAGKQDTLDWMTQQEAADLWTAAWNAAT